MGKKFSELQKGDKIYVVVSKLSYYNKARHPHKFFTSLSIADCDVTHIIPKRVPGSDFPSAMVHCTSDGSDKIHFNVENLEINRSTTDYGDAFTDRKDALNHMVKVYTAMETEMQDYIAWRQDSLKTIQMEMENARRQLSGIDSKKSRTNKNGEITW